MNSIARKSLFALVAFGGAALWPQLSRADWYQTWYPQYYGPPVVRYYWPPQPRYYVAPPPYRAYERWSGTPQRPRYRYEEKYPGGVEYEYRVDRDRDGYRVREKWDD